MTAETPRPEFVDTNVLVYAFDTSAGEKRARAQALLERLWQAGGGALSVQVLQEFYVTLTRKLAKPLPPEIARPLIADLSTWKTYSPTPQDVLAAIDLQQSYSLSFWDAMIIQSALALGCERLWSEDLSHGQTYAGVQVLNPFAG